MSGFQGIMKGGWHPKGRDGGKESWRGDFKGINQVAGWMGKSRDPNKKDGEEHVSRPLTALKDPASFGPPPKHVNYHGGAALPNEITPQRSGWGAPLSQEQMASATPVAQGPTEEEIEEERRRAGPPLPYRADRTGLRTDHLPPPPVHRDQREVEPVETVPPKPKPGLPPRLPSRQNTGATSCPPPSAISPPPAVAPPAYDAIPAAQPEPQAKSNWGINQSAVNRLGNAGMSVPGLGIGSGSSNPWRNEQSQSSQPKSPPPSNQSGGQLSELQARFARMGSGTSTQSHAESTPPFVTPAQSPAPMPTPGQPQPQTQGTTWAEKQAAMRTAQSAYKDPSQVSVQDAASAAKTANNFRDRHKDTIDAAGVRASSFNKKYNVTGRLGSFLEKANADSPTTPNGTPANNVDGSPAVASAAPVQQTSSQNPELTASISRKPPPPPPPKKPAGMHGSVGSLTAGAGAAPPPVPLGTRPSFT